MRYFLLMIGAVITFSSFAKNDPEITLKQIELFKGRVKIKVPEQFKILNEGAVKEVYKGLPTIKLVYANDDETVRIAFGTDDLLAPKQSLPQMTSLMKEWLQNRLEKNKWKSEGVTEVNKINFGYLEYILKKPEKYYEFMFFTLFRGQMISCSVHSPKKGYKFWKGISEQMMESLILVKEKE